MALRALLLAALLATLVVAPGAQPGQVSGLDRSGFDDGVRPQDDLYRFVNGRWFDSTPMPPERVTYDTFAELADQAERDVRDILEGLPRHGAMERQIRDLYASLMDEERIEALGATPIQADLDRIAAIASPAALAAEVGRLSAMNAGGPFGASAGIDAANPSRLVVTVSQGGTLLPDRDYYLKNDAASRAIRDRYLDYLETVFTLTNAAAPLDRARGVMALETRLAAAQQPQAEARIRAPGQPFTLQAATEAMPGFHWADWAKPQGIDKAATIVFEQPAFFRAFAHEFARTPLETWKGWLTARYVTAVSIYLSRAFADARFEFFGRVLSGQEAPIARWKRGVSLVNGFMGDAMGQLYVERHFPESSRRRVRAIVRRVAEAFRETIDEAEWLSPQARRQARVKLDFLRAGIGGPDRWRRYERLQIRADDLLGNAQRAQAFENDYRMMRLRRRIEPSQWLIPPQTVNAYYTPSRNEIILPAAILRPPMFDPAAEDAVNYGGIGAIIGHEIGHAFDQRGRRFDAHGRADDWWTADDETQFRQRTSRLIAQFNEYAPIPGHFVNGELTFGENVGDLVGLAVAIRAYRLSLQGRPSPVMDGYTGEQRLLLNWARIWRAKVRETYVPQTLMLNRHAPHRFRANGTVVNIDAFHEAFGVKPGDQLYRAPQDRVRIW